MSGIADQEMERALLGAVLLGAPVELDTSWFNDLFHERVARAVQQLRASGKDPDPVLVASEMGASKEERLALIEIVNKAGLVSQADRYAKELAELAARRRVYRACRLAAEAAKSGDGWEKAAEAVAEAAEPPVEAKHIAGLVEERVEATAEARQAVWLDGFPGVALHFGDLAIVGARPAVGKSAFAAQVAFDLARRGLKTMVWSLEMTADDWADRFIVQHAPFDTERLDRGLDDKERSALAELMRSLGLERVPLSVVDDATATVEEICAAIRAFGRRGGRVVVLDYLQLAVSSKGGRRYEAVTEASRMLKLAARSSGVLLIALSQLSRSPVADGKNRPPTLADLRESGALEQDADDVVLLHRFDKDDEDARAKLRKQRYIIEDDEGEGGSRALCRIDFAKMRRGKTRIFPALFDGADMRFYPLDKEDK